MELERGDQPVPRIGVVDAGEGGVERRRRREAVAADRRRRRAAARRSAGSAARRGAKRARQSAQTRPRPQPRQTAHRLGQRRPPRRCAGRAGARAGRRHRLNILPAMAGNDRAGGRAASMRSRSSAALRRMAARPRAALAAPRGRRAAWPSAWRRCGSQPAARARLVGRPRRRPRRAAAALSAGASIVAVEPDAAWLRARCAVVARGRWWSLGRRWRGAGADVAGEPDAALRPRPAGLGQHGAARRRRSAGAVRALASRCSRSMAS